MENLDGLTAGYKPITSDDHVRFCDGILPSAKRIQKQKAHVEMVITMCIT